MAYLFTAVIITSISCSSIDPNSINPLFAYLLLLAFTGNTLSISICSMRFYFSRHLYDICVEHINMFSVDSACELYLAYKHAHCGESLWYVELKCGI